MPWLYFLDSQLLLCRPGGLELWDAHGYCESLALPRPSLAVATPQRRCCLLAVDQQLYALQAGRPRAFEAAAAPLTALSCSESLVAGAMGLQVALWSLQGQRLAQLPLAAAVERRSWAFSTAEALTKPQTQQLLMLEELMARGPRPLFL